MSRKRINESDFDDFAPVTVGRGSRVNSLSGSADFRSLKCSSPLDEHLVHLMTLHASLGPRFAKQDLSQLDDQAKRELLEDMNDLLGIRG